MDNSQNNERILQIDVKQVLTDKNPSLAKVIPGFVIRYLKRIVHQDEINDFLRQYGKLQDSEFIKAGLDSSILPTNVTAGKIYHRPAGISLFPNHPSEA